MHERTKRLLELKKQHKLTGKRIAELAGVEHNTALIWQMQDGPRVIPFAKLYKLECDLNGEFRPLD